MKTDCSIFVHLTFIFFLGASLHFVNGNLSETGGLDQVIREASKESKLIASEIERWLIRESGSMVAHDEQTHHRSRRSSKETKGDGEMDGKQKKNGKGSYHLLKKEEVDIQADKHHVRKGASKKKEKDSYSKKVTGPVKNKRTPQLKGKKQKKSKIDLKKDNDKFDLVTALIDGGRHDKQHKDRREEVSAPGKAYRQLVEYIASGDQSGIETTSKKSEIAKPSSSSKMNHEGSEVLKPKAKQVHHKKVSKKHRRVLAMLQKMPGNVLRKYLHRKGLDKYWKVVDNLQKINSATRAKKQRQKNGKHVQDHKSLAQAKVKHAEKKSTGGKRVQDNPQKVSKLVSLRKDKEKPIKKLGKVEHVQTASGHKVAKLVKQAPRKKLESKTAKAHSDKKETNDPGGKTKVIQHSKSSSFSQKDKPKHRAKKMMKDDTKVGKEIMKSESHGTTKITSKAKDSSVQSKKIIKPKLSEVKHSLKQDGKTTPAFKKKDSKIAKGKALAVKNMTQNPSKAAKVKHVQAKDSISHSTKTKKLPELININDQSIHQTKAIKVTKPKVQEQQDAVKLQVKATTTKPLTKTRNESSTKEANDKPKELKTTQTPADHHVITTAPSHLEANSSSKEQHPALSKIDYLKDKIRKTNNLKFKVAQALLAHCETQNKLRQVFDEVNTSLKKAATLARAIGSKFGIKQSDIDKMTSDHTEHAVEQFLNQLF